MKDELEGQEQDKEVTLETAEQKVEQSKEALEAAIEEKAGLEEDFTEFVTLEEEIDTEIEEAELVAES